MLGLSNLDAPSCVETRSTLVYQPRERYAPSQSWRTAPAVLGVPFASWTKGKLSPFNSLESDLHASFNSRGTI